MYFFHFYFNTTISYPSNWQHFLVFNSSNACSSWGPIFLNQTWTLPYHSEYFVTLSYFVTTLSLSFLKRLSCYFVSQFHGCHLWVSVDHQTLSQLAKSSFAHVKHSPRRKFIVGTLCMHSYSNTYIMAPLTFHTIFHSLASIAIESFNFKAISLPIVCWTKCKHWLTGLLNFSSSRKKIWLIKTHNSRSMSYMYWISMLIIRKDTRYIVDKAHHIHFTQRFSILLNDLVNLMYNKKTDTWKIQQKLPSGLFQVRKVCRIP